MVVFIFSANDARFWNTGCILVLDYDRLSSKPERERNERERMIYNKDYFTKGEVEGALVVEETNYFGDVTDVRSYTANLEGEFVLTLAWDKGRESKTYSNFATALKYANGHWARQSIWHITPNGRKRIMRWQ